MLDAGKAIRLHKGRLEVCDPKADAKLARILAGGFGGELHLTGPGLTGVTIHIHPCVEALGGAGAGLRTIRITDLNRERELPTPARLRDRLGLTSRQAQVAAELARGVTEAEAAAKLELRAPTRHTHVRRIYEKLDLRRCIEPVAAAAGARTFGNLGAGSFVYFGTKKAAVQWIGGPNRPKRISAMQKPLRLLLCASTAALILGAAPIGAFIAPAQAQVAISISATIAPPILPVYAQPPIPGPGYLWIPGYWAWNGEEYYWVPGYWSMPPTVGVYWTPPYWAWLNGAYVFYAGYWGPTVGFYGGINYGFGYNGVGYQGGFWRGNTFVYNRTVNNFGNVSIANSYSRPVFNPANHVAFNGGNGGTTARPTQAQMAARASGAPPTAEQTQHQQAASKNPALGFNANHGAPPITAMQRPNEFHGAAAATNTPAEHPPAATQNPVERPQVATPAQPPRPQVAEHAAPAPRHYAYHAPAARQHYAYHAPVAHPHVAYHAPAARPHVAYHAPVMHPNVAYHAPVIHQNVASHAPVHMPAAHAAARPHVSAPPVKRTP